MIYFPLSPLPPHHAQISPAKIPSSGSSHRDAAEATAYAGGGGHQKYPPHERQQQRYDDGVETLSRAQDIVAEILCSLDVKSNEQIAKSLGSIYLFIFRCLAEGGMKHDEQKLDDALRVLNAERETWRLFCEKFGSSTDQSVTDQSTSSATNSQSVDYKPSGAPATYNGKAGGGKISTFTQGVRPLGAPQNSSPIQTNPSLAAQPASPTQEKPASPGGSSWDA